MNLVKFLQEKNEKGEKMAERRMFSKTIIDSDLFMDLPVEAQVLYFHLGMRADDDGFIGNSKKLCRMLGLGEENLEVLIEKELLIKFDSGVIAVKHWKKHNYIAKDRYSPTVYTKEKSTVTVDEKGMYTDCIQPVYKASTQVRLGKDSIGKDSLDKDSLDKDSLDKDSLDKDSLAYISPSGDIAASAASSACAEQSNKVDFSFSSASAEQPTQNSYSAPSAAPKMDKPDISADTPKTNKGDTYINDKTREADVTPKVNKPYASSGAAPRTYNPDTFFEMPKAGDDAPRFDNLVPEEYTKDPQWENHLAEARASLRKMFGAPKPPKKPDTKPRYGSFDPEEAMAIAIARTEYEFAKTDKNESS